MTSISVNDHILLESLTLSMTEEVFSAINDNRDFLQKWLPFVEYTQQISDTENFIHGVIEQRSVKRDEVFCIRFEGVFAGLIGFKDTDWVNRKTEIGYWLVENMQGKGIITLSVQKLVSYSFQKLKLNRIQIKVAEGNEKSAAVPKRLSFHFEGVERAGEKHGANFFDLKIFSLLRSDS